MTTVRCLLFFDPEDLQKKGYALICSDKLEELPAFKRIFRRSSIEVIEEGHDISSQDATKFVAVESEITLGTSWVRDSVRCAHSYVRMLESLFKSTDLLFDSNLFKALEKDVTIGTNVLKQFRSILASTADIPFMDSGDTLLHFAARRGYDALFEMLLECGADVNIKTTDGSTLLHSAASAIHAHNVSFAQKIIAMGGDVNAVNARGQTPLHVAAGLGDGSKTIVEFLLQSGADVHATDSKGGTPLICAFISPEVIQVLMKNGALLDAETLDGRTVLLEAVNNVCFNAAEYIVNLGSSLNVNANKEAFYMAFCKYSSKPKLVRAMLQRGFAITPDDLKRPDVFYGAIRLGMEDVVKKFLDMGFPVNHQNFNRYGSPNKTPLHQAVDSKQEHIVRLLMEHGADINKKVSSCGLETPLDFAVNVGSIELVKLLFEANVNDRKNPKLLSIALKATQLNILKFLLESGLDPNCVYDDGHMCFASAKTSCTIDFIDCLVNFGACFRYWDIKSYAYTNDKTVMLTVLGLCPLTVSADDLWKIDDNRIRCNSEVDWHLMKLDALSPERNMLESMERRPNNHHVAQAVEAEVKKLDESIGDTQLKYRDILTSVERTSRFVNIPSVIEAMDEKVLRNRFPKYFNLLKSKFQIAVLRNTLSDQVIPILRMLLSRFSPPHQLVQPALAVELMEMIISHLSVRDLVVLQKFICIKQSPNSSS